MDNFIEQLLVAAARDFLHRVVHSSKYDIHPHARPRVEAAMKLVYGV